MKILILLLTNLLYISAIAQKLNDGPYVLYRGDNILVKTIEDSIAVQHAYSLKEKDNIEIPVRFAAHPQWDFKVKLKSSHEIEPSVFGQPEKMFFVSDIEGEFDGFRRLLIANGIINEKYEWTFGKGHLVLCGDLFDRGSQVPECLWLLYKLEELAEKAGGYLHLIMGNHDVMNLSGDLRYLQPKYLESAKLMGVDYMQLYSAETELGRWLRGKNIIEKIGDNLCAHAGIAPQINKLGLSLQQINDTCRLYYDRAKNKAAVQEMSSESAVHMLFSGSTSPFWYRGYFMRPKARRSEVEETLRLFGVSRIVVGHTIVRRNIGFRYRGRVLGIDVDHHAADHWAALYEKGKWWKVDDQGSKLKMTW